MNQLALSEDIIEARAQVAHAKSTLKQKPGDFAAILALDLHENKLQGLTAQMAAIVVKGKPTEFSKADSMRLANLEKMAVVIAQLLLNADLPEKINQDLFQALGAYGAATGTLCDTFKTDYVKFEAAGK